MSEDDVSAQPMIHLAALLAKRATSPLTIQIPPLKGKGIEKKCWELKKREGKKKREIVQGRDGGQEENEGKGGGREKEKM